MYGADGPALMNRWILCYCLLLPLTIEAQTITIGSKPFSNCSTDSAAGSSNYCDALLDD